MPDRSVFVSNFGCRAAQSEGAAIERELLDGRAAPADSPFSASVVIVNTCTVTEEADREARQLIRRIASRNPQAKIIVTGCYAQRAPEEVATLPHVSHVVGNSHKPMTAALAMQVLERPETFEAGRAEIFCSSIFTARELQPETHTGSAGRTRAIVKVQDGCNANCSFCVIPSVRGRSRSLAPSAVIAEIRELAERGYKEVVLSGIHLGTYGRDLEPRTSLAELLGEILNGVPQLQRLRLSSVEPLEMVSGVVDLICSNPRLARHFHIPLQSGSERILRLMRRPYSASYYRDLTTEIRRRVEDAAIGADVMVGFPGESDAEFMETCRLIEESPLTYLHVFPYSSRPGTVAADLPFHVPANVARFRAKALRDLIARKNADFRSRMVGRELETLVLEQGEGLSTNFIRVELPHELARNEWVRVEILGTTPEGLQAVSRITTAQETS